MKISELFKNRDPYNVTAEEIVARETASARKSYPNARSDVEALAFLASHLSRRIADLLAKEAV
jgi:hypothetical protein